MSQKGKGAVIKLTIEQQELLIDLVEERPPIYDARSRDHRNKNITQKMWIKIVEELNVKGMDWERCKAKWKNIKDYFNTMCKKVRESQRSGAGAKIINRTVNSFIPSKIVDKDAVSDDEENAIDEQAERAEVQRAGTSEDEDPQADVVDDSDDELTNQTQESQSEQKKQRGHDATSMPGTSKSPSLTPSLGQKSRPKKRKMDRMESLMTKLEQEYMDDGKQIDKIEQDLKSKMTSFYVMMDEKMASFSRRDQILMESQIWNFYMQL